MFDLTFIEQEEIQLPSGEVYQVVGVKLRDIKKVIKLIDLHLELVKQDKEASDEILTIMDEIISLGLIDKETKQSVIFPQKYRTIKNDMELFNAIMNATLMGRTKTGSSYIEKSKEQILKEIEGCANYLLINTQFNEEEILDMRYPKFRGLISYIADPKSFMIIDEDPETVQEEIREFQRANIEFMKQTQKKPPKC